MESNRSPQPLMLVHAWGESGRSFDRLISYLPSWIDPIAVNLPGDREHVGEGVDYSVKGLARYLETQLEIISSPTEGAVKPVVLGSSSGGYLAQQLAVDHPELLSALILVGSPATLQGEPTFVTDVERLADPVDPSWVRNFFSWFPIHHSVPPEYLEDRVRDGAAIPAQVWLDTLVGLCRATPPLETGRITIPTLVISGRNDDLLGPAHRDLVDAILNSKGVVYDHTGHLVLWERPASVARDVANFLDNSAGHR